MEHVSLHGLAFAGLQLVIVLALHWALWRWHDPKRAGPRTPRTQHAIPMLVGLGFIAWYLLLRTRPAARGGDPFEFTLGIFDGISIAGITTLVLVHMMLTKNGPPHVETPDP
jgi:hypothetical protein